MDNKEVFDSWKDISRYLERDIRTCYRWEKELGLPVYRIDQGSLRSKVFAYKSDIDGWLKEKTETKEVKWKSLLKNNSRIFGLIAALFLLLTIPAFLRFYRGNSSPALSENLAIAVLPFENINSSKSDGYFPDGITNEIISNIIESSKIKVISQNLAAGENNGSKTAKQLGKELGVDYILKAKMNNDDNKIKINIQLVRTRDGKKILNEEYGDEQKNISSLCANICKRINESLNITPSQEPLLASNEKKSQGYLVSDNYLREKYLQATLLEGNNDPWKLYWQGRFLWAKSSLESNNLAVSFFRKAMEIDSGFALAYIGLAYCYSNYVNFSWDFDIKWLNQAEGLIKKAQTLSPDLPEYYAALIEIYLVKETGFNEDTRKIVFDLVQEGIKKYPYHSQLNSVAGSYYFLRFGEEGNEADFERALEYKEKSFWADITRPENFIFAEFLMLNKEFSKAAGICEIIKEYDSSSLAKFRLGEIYYYQGDLDKSQAIFKEFDNAPMQYKIDSLFYLAMIASQRDEKDRALQIVDKINLLYPNDIIINGYLKFASIYLGLEMRESGYKYLKSFFEMQMAKKMRFIFIKYIDLDKNFDNFREEKEFQKIIKNREE
jgi:TolB-like protein